MIWETNNIQTQIPMHADALERRQRKRTRVDMPWANDRDIWGHSLHVPKPV